mgnify:CR=1 FL=1
MRWYEKLYVGEKAKKHRYETIQAVRNGRPMGFYVLTPAAGDPFRYLSGADIKASLL